ncbi:MAG: glycosyltransferase family 4 protein [Fervidobacterium sp.]|nr:glycosyltransferase family 4 protein [Fervidobacterium sp.]
MRVAMVSSDNSKIVRRGGKHIHQDLLERGLRHIGVSVETFYPEVILSKFDFFKKLLKTDPLSIFSKKKRVIANTNRLLRFFSNLQLSMFDLVHCHDVIAVQGVNHENIILTLHGYLAKEAVNYMGDKYSQKVKKEVHDFLADVEKSAMRKAKHIIVVDSRIKSYVIDELNYSAENVTVLYNAIDTDLFTPVDEQEKIKLRQKLKIPVDAFIVLVPRRYVKKNGVLYAAEAFSKIKSHDFFFVFAGGGHLKKELEKLLENNKNKLILDSIPNETIHEYYKASDVVLIPSVSSDGVEEATSLSMLEGMACGKVTICSSIGGMKEVVKHSENGLLIEQASPKSIIESIIFVKENYASLETLRRNARNYVVKNHSYIEHAKKVYEIYQRVNKK